MPPSCSVPTDGWPELLRAFRAGIEQCVALTGEERALAEPYHWGQETMTVGYALLDVAAHNAYHVGQIVLLRQLIGAWPPEGGAFTW